MLTERPILIGQKLVENAKIQKIKCDILSKYWNENSISWKITDDTNENSNETFLVIFKHCMHAHAALKVKTILTIFHPESFKNFELSANWQ